MIIDLMDKDDRHGLTYNCVEKLILSTKEQFLKNGGDPADFPEYLKSQGILMLGFAMQVPDEFVTMAKLKYTR